MKKKYHLTLSLMTVFASTQTLAAANFNISPQAGTPLPTSITPGGSVSAFYTVTNNTSSTRSGYFVKGLPAAVTQNTSNGNCSSPVVLAAKASCVLQLDISGKAVGSFSLCRGSSCTTASVPLNVTVATQSASLIAVGSYYDNSNEARPLIATSINNGTSWSYTVTGLTSGFPTTFAAKKKYGTNMASFHIFSASDCTGTSCVAAGGYLNNSQPLVATSVDNGLTWNYTLTDNIPSKSFTFSDGDFNSASCNGTTCIAGGTYFDGDSFPFVATSVDSGKSWSYSLYKNNPSISFPYTNASFYGVNCNNTACIGIGDYYDGVSHYFLAATSINKGASWAYTLNGNSTLPTGYTDSGSLAAASSSNTNFIAVGSYNSSSVDYPVIALGTNNGQSWSYSLDKSFITPSTLPDFDGYGRFYSVNCSGANCIAGGSYQNTSGGIEPLLATSTNSGINWTFTITGANPALPSDAGTGASVSAYIYKVSCSGNICIAAGQYKNTTTTQYGPLLAQSSNGGQTWTYRITSTYPTLTGDTIQGGALDSASCKGLTCIAAGRYYNGTEDYPLIAQSTDGGVTWAYKVNRLSPDLPSDYQLLGGFRDSSISGIAALLPNSLQFIINQRTL